MIFTQSIHSLKDFLQLSVQGKLNVEEQKTFLKSYEIDTPEELKEVVLFFREHCPPSLKIEGAIDVCGTGGSGQKKINVSTLSALVLAALGVKIAKHGNRAVTGQCGSFDLLDSLELNFSKPNKNLEVVYEKENCVFLYAPLFYPIMRFFAQARKELSQPTFFNLIGPLLSPVSVKKQIIGTAFKGKMRLLVETAKLLGSEHVYVVSSEEGLDEISLNGKTQVVELNQGRIEEYTLCPKDFGLPELPKISTRAGTIIENKSLAEAILAGKGEVQDEDTVLVNVALALKLTGEKDLKKAYKKAKKVLKSGLVQKKVESLKMILNTPSILLEIAENKKKEVAQRKKKVPLKEIMKGLRLSQRNAFFLEGLRRQSKHLSLIAELKLASPSKGTIAALDPVKRALEYEQAGSTAISVLCDKRYFKGDLKSLEKISKSTRYTPLLCKDFIIDEYQIYEARKMGADLILLIAALLDRTTLEHFIEIARRLKMTALCEVHTEKELEEVLQTSAEVIGLNNRDLNTFQIDLSTTQRLVPLIPNDKIIISESGFEGPKEVNKLPSRVKGILVGTALMQSSNVERKVLELKGKTCKVKICGIQSLKEAQLCEAEGVDFIGLNFAPDSKRKVSLKVAIEICKKIRITKKVGVFRNQTLEKVNQLSRRLKLDYVQLSGEENLRYVRACESPVIKTIKISKREDLKQAQKFQPHVSYLLFDAATPGEGKLFNHKLLKTFKGDYLLAGGLNIKNIPGVLDLLHPLGIDLASGVETKGKRDLNKLKNLLHLL